MAPIRSRPQASVGAGVGKKVNRKAHTHRESSDSWELLDRQGLSAQNNFRDDSEGGVHEYDDANNGDMFDVDQVISPLRETADRVGREVETFAETLDQFFNDLPTVSSRFDAAHDLVLKFQQTAKTMAEELKQSHEREAREQLRKEWSEQAQISAATTSLTPFTSNGAAALSKRKAEQVKELRLWQQEADIWELFRIMLELHPFEADARAMRAEKEEKLAKLGPPHRYTSEGDLWERFLMEDDLARERSMIKTWLEQSADHQISEVPSIVEELESKAGRGKGLWSSGWMHTREKIKGEKRLKTWSTASDAPLPQIRRSDNTELLTTSLDPDAPHRQNRTLEKPDAYFERAIWVACWEMLRRGKSLHEISDWCEERKEGWRALVMGGALDLSDPTTSSDAWRHMCLTASQSVCMTDYQAAVLGSIGGNVGAMDKVSHSIDDHLYAHYSAALTLQFRHYLASTCPDRAAPASWRRGPADDTILDPGRAQEAISDLIARLRRDESTGTEAAKPMKIIQSFLLADEVGSLIHTVGAAVSETAALQGPEDMIFLRERQVGENVRPRGEVEVALDPRTLRIVTHMSIIHRILSPDYLEGDELLEDENVLVAYIQALRKAGKRLLIPLYASQLQKARYIVVLGRVLQDITDTYEQAHMLRLLEDQEMDVKAILREQLSWILDTKFVHQYADKPVPILESTTDTKLHPGQRIIRQFLHEDTYPNDQYVIAALQWFQLLHADWEEMFAALTSAVRKCLVTGAFSCAQLIVKTFPPEDVSISKSYEIIGRAVNIMDETTWTAETDNETMMLKLMKRQARTYSELDMIVQALLHLSAWRSEEWQYITKAIKPSAIPPFLKSAKGEVDAAMRPLLHGVLQHPLDDREARDLAHIRLTYLPEMILAYQTVLHSAGNLITREALLDSMDLGVFIVNDGNGEGSSEEERMGNGLLELFVKTGRLRELVQSFAYTSKMMLVLKSEGRPWRPKKDRVGRNLGIWELYKEDPMDD